MQASGSTLASHELIELLGTGGMGSVWLARRLAEPYRNALVALKTMREDQASDPRFRSLFAKEMRLAAAIVHPNVASVLETGEADGVPYLAMEWVDGCSVRQLSRAAMTESGSTLPLDIALRITADVCAGLHAAHELTTIDGTNLGLVHRDVSPHNVIVSRAGVAKLIDFGIAKVRSAVSGDSTSSSGIKGKVRYMAPEQARGQAVDRRADIFALGAMLFELVTGSAPFEGPNDLAVLHQLLGGAPTEIPAHVPAPVADILRRALAKKARDRFATAEEMREALLAAIDPMTDASAVACLVARTAPAPSVAIAPTNASSTWTSMTTTKLHKKRMLAFMVGAAITVVVGAFTIGRTERVAAAAPVTHVAQPTPVVAAEPKVALDLPATEAPREEKPAPKPAQRAKKRAASAPDDLTTALRERR